MNIKYEYYFESLENETFENTDFCNDEYGVFSNEPNKEGHCYFYGSHDECKLFCDKKNNKY